MLLALLGCVVVSLSSPVEANFEDDVVPEGSLSDADAKALKDVQEVMDPPEEYTESPDDEYEEAPTITLAELPHLTRREKTLVARFRHHLELREKRAANKDSERDQKQDQVVERNLRHELVRLKVVIRQMRLKYRAVLAIKNKYIKVDRSDYSDLSHIDKTLGVLGKQYKRALRLENHLGHTHKSEPRSMRHHHHHSHHHRRRSRHGKAGRAKRGRRPPRSRGVPIRGAPRSKPGPFRVTSSDVTDGDAQAGKKGVKLHFNIHLKFDGKHGYRGAVNPMTKNGKNVNLNRLEKANKRAKVKIGRKHPGNTAVLEKHVKKQLGSRTHITASRVGNKEVVTVIPDSRSKGTGKEKKFLNANKNHPFFTKHGCACKATYVFHGKKYHRCSTVDCGPHDKGCVSSGGKPWCYVVGTTCGTRSHDASNKIIKNYDFCN